MAWGYEAVVDNNIPPQWIQPWTGWMTGRCPGGTCPGSRRKWSQPRSGWMTVNRGDDSAVGARAAMEPAGDRLDATVAGGMPSGDRGNRNGASRETAG